MTITLSRLTVDPQQTAAKSKSRSGRTVLLALLYLASIVLLIWLFADGLPFYLTPYAERPHHPDYRTLRPAGARGLIYGIVGAAMMVIMLVYSVRKRTRLLGQTVRLSSLLDFHIYLGIIGPLFILLHTSFKIQGLVAVSFWSMTAVALSGYFGRYLYLQIPRNIQGSELGLKELTQETDELGCRLAARFHLSDADLSRVDAVFREFTELRHSALVSVLALLRDDLLRWPLKRRLKARLARAILLPRPQLAELFAVSFRRALLNRRIQVLASVQQVFHYWHVIHKPFAIVMYIIMGIHIGVAIWTGYGWIH